MLDKKMFLNAFRGTYMSYERVAEGDFLCYSEELKNDLEKVEDQERYIETYKKYLYSWLGTLSGCYSWFISGPSNYPKAKMAKKYDLAHSKFTEFRDIRHKILMKKNKVSIDIYEEVERLGKEILFLKKKQDYLKSLNKIKFFKSREYALENKELIDSTLIGLSDIKYFLDIGKIPSFMLTAVNTKIKSRILRLDALKDKVYLKENIENKIIFENEKFKIIENYEIDRIQFEFDGKPDEATRTILKKRAFKWSPKNSVWQRQMTPNAKFATKCIIENLSKLE